MKKSIFLGLVLTVIVCINCSIKDIKSISGHLPSALIYKTKKNYDNYVPVTLSADKSHIVSYPAPQDVFYQGKLALPTKLAGGFLLDNRGIGQNSCFINITYQDYSKLSQAPSPDSLYNMVLDKNPFKNMYDLGPRNHFSDEAKDIDSIIRHHHLKEYTKLL